MEESIPVLVLISGDPRTSHRANEAMRIALGIAAGEADVTVVLAGSAAHLLDADTDDLVDGDDIARHRSTLTKLGIPFHVERSVIPTGMSNWNEEGHTVIPVSTEDLAELMARSRHFLVF